MPAFPRANLRDLVEGAERFVRAVPGLAASLGRPVPEPMTERFIEGTSVLAATVLDKTEDLQRYAFELLADRAAPWLRRPIPAASVMAFEPAREGRVVVASTTILPSVPIDGVVCSFRPIRDVVLHPLRVEETSIEARPGGATVVRIRIVSTGKDSLNTALAEGVPLYVDGSLETALLTVFALTSNVTRAAVEVPEWASPISIDPRTILRAELGPESALAPDPDGRPEAFGAFVEAAVFPDKFRFLRLPGLAASLLAPPARSAVFSFELGEGGLGDARLRPGDVRAHCAPVVNLFEASAEPLPLDVERGEVPLRVVGLPRRGGGVYAVKGAAITARRGEHSPLALPDMRRLAAAAVDPRCPAVFATSVVEIDGREPDVTVAFGRRAGADADDAVERVVSMTVLATNRHLASRVRTGDIAGTLATGQGAVAYRNVVPGTTYVPPPTGESFSLRALRHARVTQGKQGALASLKDMLFQSVPSWAGREEWVRAQFLRIHALEGLEVSVARRVAPDGGVRRGHAYRLRVDESAFRGAGELGLFGATVGEALSRSSPVGTFVELTLVGRRGTFEAVFPTEGRP